MAEKYNVTEIWLAADTIDNARKAKQYLLDFIEDYGITAEKFIKIGEFVKENDDMFRTVIDTLNRGGDLKSIALPLIQKAMLSGKKSKK